MKKFLIGAAIIAAAAAVSCKDNSQCQSTECSAFTDSLSTSFGSYVGASLAMQSQDYTPEQKQEFMAAFQRVMTAASTEPEIRGALVAAQILQSVEQFREHDNIDISATATANGFRRIFLMDSVDYPVIMKYSSEFQEFRNRALTEARAQAEAEAMQSPEAQQNGRVAANYVDRIKAADSTIVTTESGLTYKILEAGEGDHPTANSTVKVKYIGKHLNGEVFDQSGDQPATFNLRGVVPGFSEGLMLLGKGGKATLYIPGELAYGAQGNPQGGIGPNEMLIFEVELEDI